MDTPVPSSSAPAGGLTEKTIVGLAWTSLAMGSQAVLQLVALILLARLLQPEQFGIFAAAMIIARFSAIFSEIGVGPAIVQRPRLETRHIRAGFTLSLLLSLAAGLTVYLAAPAIARFFQMPDLTSVVRVMALGFPLQGISIVAQSLALREFKFRWLAFIDAGAFALGFLVVAPALTMLDFGVYALAAAYLAQHITRASLLLLGQPHPKMPLLEVRAFRELLYFGAGFTLGRIGNFLAGEGDNLIVGRWLGPMALGLYAHAYQLMAAPAMLVGQVLDRVLFPTMASVQFEPQRLIRAYRSGIFACALLILPASIVIAVVANEIVLVLLGSDWSGVASPLQILACGMLFRTSYKISDTIVRATGAVYARAWRQAVFAIAVFGAAAIGQAWGLSGVAVGVLIALGANFALMAHLSLRLTGMRWMDFGMAHLPGLVLTLTVGSSAYVLVTWLRSVDTPPLLVLVSVALLVATLVPASFWVRPSFFLGPDSRQLLLALSKVMPVVFRHRLSLLQGRIS